MRTLATLPCGLWHDGRLYRDAELAPLSVDDELAVTDLGADASPAAKVSFVLARALARLGPLDTVGPADVGRLVAGDREALLLQLRALGAGDAMRCLVTCANATCGERLEVDVSVRELLLAPYADAGPWFDTRVGGKDDPCLARFRLPNGADLERAADATAATADAAAAALVLACTESTRRERDGTPATLAPAAVVAAVADAIAERDPQAELVLDLACPVCRTRFPALLDAAAVVLDDVGARAARATREVHLLALHYHWSERDILAMPATRRRLHVALLAETLAQGRAG